MKKSAYKIIAPKLKSAYQLDSGASSGPAILPNKQKSIFAITCNQNTNALREAIF